MSYAHALVKETWQFLVSGSTHMKLGKKNANILGGKI